MEMDKLLPDVKNHLDVTWEDVEIDKKIKSFILTAIQKFDRLANEKNEYKDGSQEKSLLLNYCLYAFNGKSNEFDSVYRKDIVEFVLDVEIRKMINEENTDI